MVRTCGAGHLSRKAATFARGAEEMMPSHMGRSTFAPLNPSEEASRPRLVPRLLGDVVSNACKLGLQGIVSGSRYRSGRRPDWLKIARPRKIGAGKMAPLIFPPPFPLPLPDQWGRSRCRLGGGVPSVGHSSPVFARFGVNFGCSAFLEVLRPLPEVGYFVHVGKFPTHERRSLTEKVGP